MAAMERDPKPKTLLGEYMMKSAEAAAGGTDVILFVVECDVPLNASETAALRSFAKSDIPCILLINKIDKINKGLLAKYLSELSDEYRFRAVIPISALEKDGLDIIFDELEPFLIESPHFFPDDMLTDQPERQIIAEIIREKMLRLLDDEIPHGTAVVIEEFKDEKTLLSVRAEIFCERESHKRIIIGKNGEMLKKIGSYAREDAEALFGTKIFLDLWVKVKDNWRDRPTLVANFGYKDE